MEAGEKSATLLGCLKALGGHDGLQGEKIMKNTRWLVSSSVRRSGNSTQCRNTTPSNLRGRGGGGVERTAAESAVAGTAHSARTPHTATCKRQKGSSSVSRSENGTQCQNKPPSNLGAWQQEGEQTAGWQKDKARAYVNLSSSANHLRQISTHRCSQSRQ